MQIWIYIFFLFFYSDIYFSYFLHIVGTIHLKNSRIKMEIYENIYFLIKTIKFINNFSDLLKVDCNRIARFSIIIIIA